jgi:adenylate cyclase
MLKVSCRPRPAVARAIEVDPRFAPAHAGLAYALYVEAIWGFVATVETDLEPAGRSAGRAVELDGKDANAHGVLRRMLMVRGNIKATLAECGTALELNPNLASAHYGFGFALGMAGHHDEALTSIGRAIRLSPFDPLMHAFLTLKCGTLITLGRYAEAVEAARDAQR